MAERVGCKPMLSVKVKHAFYRKGGAGKHSNLRQISVESAWWLGFWLRLAGIDLWGLVRLRDHFGTTWHPSGAGAPDGIVPMCMWDFISTFATRCSRILACPNSWHDTCYGLLAR